MQILIIILVIAFYFIVSLMGTNKILKSISFSRSQKKINIILIWCIPFFWYWGLLTVLKTTPGSQEFSDKEKHDSSHFYESGNGSPGSGISNM